MSGSILKLYQSGTFSAHCGAKLFSRRMVSTRAAVDQSTIVAEMQREMNRQLEELRRKNEEEINALKEENQHMQRQMEQNSQQREESHSNGEGESGTRQYESKVQTTTNQTGARLRIA